jgi:hypothetical protein
VTPPAGSPRDDLSEVLRRDEFDRSPSWISRVGHAIGRAFHAIPFGTVGQFLLWILLAVVAFFVVRAVVRGVMRALDRRRRRRDDDGNVVDDVVDDLAARSAGEWRADAMSSEAIEDWREAIRCRYAELVTTLFEQGRAVDQPGRTTGELRVDVARSTPACEGAFDEITEIFELVWFADRPATPDAHRRLVQLAEWMAPQLVPTAAYAFS